MSSRPPMSVPQRQPPSRSQPSSSPLSQRPAHQRTLSSQQCPPPSPARSNTGDLAADGTAQQNATVAQTQYGTPRRGGSRLRLELSNEGLTHTGFVESPTNTTSLDSSKSFTPSRVMPSSIMTDVSDLADVASPRASRGGQMTDNDNTPLPMPRRRARFAVPEAKKEPAVPAPAPAKKEVRPKPHTIDVPATAPRYLLLNASGKADSQSRYGGCSGAHLTAYADFSPWTGDGPEDHFTQTYIQTGFFDKAAAAAQSETSSAKGAIYQNLKHKSGLYALSTVFTGILGSRRHTGQINSASTFKPPPRVTLTDTKREAWLKDLANPATSLRRLSRTIPHGVRGKGLLEHCLNKNVPTDRAVWLAKCVGANEIRAFKRKGVNGAVVMGGEAKWIRDWTMFVEQFLDGIVFSFGDTEWKNKVNYAIRLATHLYAEQLLDRDHYMEWLVSGLENCPLSKLPMWILITQIYWKDLLKLRQYGRRLVAALLTQHTIIHNDDDRDVLAPLLSRLLRLITSLMTSSSVNFISPSSWVKHRDALHSALPREDEAIHAAYKIIDARNEQLVSSVRPPPGARHDMVKMLDSTLQTPMSDDLPNKCWNLSPDQSLSVRTVLEWCTSLHRPGLAKVYVAYRFLTTWTTFGLDATAAILDFMHCDPLAELDRKTTLYHLVSELARQGCFDSLRYVQWLIARGGLHDPNSVARNGPASSRLLAELPLYALPSSLTSMRANMLGRASYDAEDEATDRETAIKCVKSTLGLQWGPTPPQSKPVPLGKLCKRIGLSSRSLKSEIGHFVRRTVILGMHQAQMGGQEGLQLPLPTFIGVRSILEAAEDFATLAELLKTTTGFLDPDLLASSADTLNLHLPVFAALGFAKGAFDTLAGRLEKIKQMHGVAGMRPLLTSMAMLAPRIPGQEALVTHLNETIRHDRNNATDASSPVSDNMAARIQDEEGELLDEIEKRLANKTSMDRTTMNSFLNKIIPKIQTCWDKVDERLRAYSALLTRLRHFDTHHFDTLMTKWVLGIRNLQAWPPLSRIFPLMISVGCLNFSIILAATNDAASSARRPASSTTKAIGTTSNYVQEVLEMLTAPPTSEGLLTAEEIYRFKILQNQAPERHLKELVTLVHNALMEYSACLARGNSQTPLGKTRSRHRLIGLLSILALTDQTAVPEILTTKTADAGLCKLMEDIATQLLLPAATPGLQVTYDQVLGLANELTLPFCQLKLAQSFGSIDKNVGANGQERQQNQLEVFGQAMDNAIEARSTIWTGMLSTLSPEISQHLLNRAQTRLFDMLPSKGRLQATECDFTVANSLLSVIDSISRGGRTAGRPLVQLGSAAVDGLAEVWELLATSSDSDVKVAIVVKWLPCMLSFLTLHANSDEVPNKKTNEVRGRVLLLLAGILHELDGSASLSIRDGRVPLKQIAQLTQQVFDVSLLLVDNVSDEVRQQCIRVLHDALSDLRLRYIFSTTAAPLNESLMLSHKDKPTMAHSQGQGSQGTQHGQQQRARGAGFLGLGAAGANTWGNAVGPGVQGQERLTAFTFKRWEILNEPTPNVGENDTSLSLTLFEAIKLQ